MRSHLRLHTRPFGRGSNFRNSFPVAHFDSFDLDYSFLESIQIIDDTHLRAHTLVRQRPVDNDDDATWNKLSMASTTHIHEKGRKHSFLPIGDMVTCGEIRTQYFFASSSLFWSSVPSEITDLLTEEDQHHHDGEERIKRRKEG